MRLAIHKGPVMIAVYARNREEARNGDVTIDGIYHGNLDITDAIDALTNIDEVIARFDWEQVWSETMADRQQYLAEIKADL